MRCEVALFRGTMHDSGLRKPGDPGLSARSHALTPIRTSLRRRRRIVATEHGSSPTSRLSPHSERRAPEMPTVPIRASAEMSRSCVTWGGYPVGMGLSVEVGRNGHSADRCAGARVGSMSRSVLAAGRDIRARGATGLPGIREPEPVHVLDRIAWHGRCKATPTYAAVALVGGIGVARRGL